MAVESTGESKPTLRVGGIVLCGGQSRRMGRAKAWLPFGSELLLPRIVRLLREAVQPIIVVAAAGQEVPDLPSDVMIVRDDEPDRGPLQGLFAGIGAMIGQVDAVYASSCDVPFLRPAFVRRMIELLGRDVIGVPQVGGYLHPLAAVYRVIVRDAIERQLRENRRRVMELFEEVPTRKVQAHELTTVDPNLETLWNVNTTEEYEKAIREHRARQDAGV